MANMSYVRFENTLSDLYDCYENMENVTSASEKIERKSLIELCNKIAQEFDWLAEEGDEDTEDEIEDDDEEDDE